MSYYRKAVFGFILLFITFPATSFTEQTNEELKNKLERAIFNFTEIEPGIYRSGQPPKETYPYLKQLGIKTIVNFINKKQANEEQEEMASLGIQTIRIPWLGFDQPKDQDVEQFLEIMRDPSYRPLLVHCRRGAERTGLMIACWRVAEKGWTAKDAYFEMKQRKYRSYWFGHLKKYLFEFAKRYGQTSSYSNNIWERAKTNFLYGIYQVRKLNPLGLTR